MPEREGNRLPPAGVAATPVPDAGVLLPPKRVLGVEVVAGPDVLGAPNRGVAAEEVAGAGWVVEGTEPPQEIAGAGADTFWACEPLPAATV